jgi:uroporphyrinogen-III decarboxylase
MVICGDPQPIVHGKADFMSGTSDPSVDVARLSKLATPNERRMEENEEALRRAYAFENDEAPHIIYDANYWLFGEAMRNIPPDYCDEDPNALVGYQLDKIVTHMERYDDAYIPFLMPWYGTGVLASGFGVEIKFLEGMDPAVHLPIMNDVTRVRELTKPDPERDGLMRRVLDTIRFMRSHTSLPVGVTDCQGPLTTACQIIGYDTISYWMYDHPDAVHELMGIVTDALIDWVTVQKTVAGQRKTDDAYVLGVKIPTGYGGVWMSDDDSVLFGTDLYHEFVMPYNSRLLKAFGGGAIHFCGNSNQHIDSYLATDGLTAIHNLNLDDIDGAARMRHALAEKGICYITADFNMEETYIEEYYEMLFRKLGTRGLIVVPYIAPAIALKSGKYVEADLDPVAVGAKIEAAILAYNRAR